MVDPKVFFNTFINEEVLVFDIGANIGNKTDLFLSLGANVIAFEPSLNVFALLKNKFKNTDNVIVENCAIGQKSGFETMFISDAHTISSLSKEWIKATQKSGRF